MAHPPLALAALAAAVLGAAVAGWIRFRRLAAVGAAYKAKVLASLLFVAEREVDVERAPEVSAEAYRPMRLFRARVDRGTKSVAVSLFGFFERRAVWRPDLGAALALRPLPPAPKLPSMPPRGAADRAWPEGEAPAPAASPALARVLAEAFAERPGAKTLRRTRAALVAQGGRLLAERYAPGVSPLAPFCGWSMTKSVLGGALIGVLVDRGILRLDQTRLLEEWDAPGDPRAAISLEDLLRMRSGLAFSEVYSDMGSDVNRMLFAEPDAAGFAASRPLAAPPGTVWKYASGTTNALSLIARRALGDERYYAWPREALFGPLGMSSAVLETDAAGTFVGSSYLHASPRDWMRFGRLFADGGLWGGRRVLSADWLRFVATPTPQSPNGKYGAHWWRKLSRELGGETPAAARLPADAFHALGHEGQCLSAIPSRGLVVLRLGVSVDVSAWDHAAFLAAVLDAVGG
ncbi:MAG: serine hydrolase [Elusimicrobia bacterium]|nr:serine hydrolase [Elusimicrobiota bacterium]